MSRGHDAVLAIDQGTTNTKALLVRMDGSVAAIGTSPVGVVSPRPGWVEQDAERIWTSVQKAVAAALAAAPETVVAGVALSTQRESVVGWHAVSGRPLGPVIGWQDSRTAAWCDSLGRDFRTAVSAKTGLPLDAMFSAPKMRWLLDHLPSGVEVDDVRVGTVDSWLIWKLTGGAVHRCDAGNASRTLLYDVTALEWCAELLDGFGVPRSVLPDAVASDAGFGATAGHDMVADGVPILAVLADSHAALFGHGCTQPGTGKVTYGTGSSVMAPVAVRSSAPFTGSAAGPPEAGASSDRAPGPAKTGAAAESAVPTTLAWVIEGRPTYALEGNILSSGAALAWAAAALTSGDIGQLLALADTVSDAGGVTLVPAFTGLGAPHWDRHASGMISGLGPGSGRAQIARAAVDAVAHQVCDVVEAMEAQTGPVDLRVDGGPTSSRLLMQTQADLLGRVITVADVAEVSALGAAKLGWRVAGQGDGWLVPVKAATFQPTLDAAKRHGQRMNWETEVDRARFKRRQTTGAP